MSAPAESVLAEARSYSDRIAIRMADTVAQQDEFKTAAFIAYLQGFKAGLAHAQTNNTVATFLEQRT